VTPSNAQTLANLHGKILRINADGSIPTDNPFFNMASGKNRTIWAMGLRNPFTFAFRAGHSEPRMFISDVGQNTYEEINDVCRRASPNSNADGESDAEWPAGDA
jgi:glucose/arabinose dehydrogenase